MKHPQLKDQDPKRVLDKIRAQWRFRKLPCPDVTSLPELPSEEETLQERVQRGLEVENETLSEIIPPTLTSSERGALSEFDLASLRTMFNDMVRKSFPIVKQRIKETLEKDPWGKDILKKVPLDTIVNRTKYERRVSTGSLTKSEQTFTFFYTFLNAFMISAMYYCACRFASLL